MTTEQIIEHTKHLVNFQSAADKPGELSSANDYIAELLAADKELTVERFERNNTPSLLAYTKGKRPEKFDVILNAHLDVVSGRPDQFISQQKDGKLYGRGTYDMKTAAIIMTSVFLEKVHTSPFKLGLQIVTDEEIGGVNGTGYQVEQGVRTDFFVAGEMTNGAICNQTRGLCWLEIKFRGKTAHGGYPWNGDNAVLQATRFAAKILEKYPTPKQETWGTSANIASITTENDTFNKVPDTATLKIDIRFTPDNAVFENEDTIRSFVSHIDPHAELRDIKSFAAAVNTPPSNPYLSKLLSAAEKAYKAPAPLIQRFGSGDGRYFAKYGTAIIEFGLSGGDAHGDNEHIDIDSIHPYQQSLLTFLHG